MNDGSGERTSLRVAIFDDSLADEGLGAPVPAGVEWEVWDSADDCVDQVEEFEADLVLMDYEMRGETTGEQAVKALRRRFGGGSLRIVGISSSSVYNEQMRAAGSDGTWPKGRVVEFLRREVERIRQRQLSDG